MKRHIPFVANYQNLGEQYILSAKVHLDESTPHMHIVFIPVVHKIDKKTGKQIDKIACSEFWKGRESYRILQDKFYKYVTDNGFDLERGKSIGAEHLSVEKFKQITEYENIKQELNEKPIQEIEIKNTSLIITQNKELIKYNRKLKNYLLKSFKAIQKVEELQEENNILKNENKKLEEKNYALNNYIENTFQVIKHLCNFPKNKLKILVDNFIKNKEK